MNMRLGEVVDGFMGLATHATQLALLWTSLEEPKADIPPNIRVTYALLSDSPQCAQLSPNHTQLGFVAKVQEAMSLDGLEHPNVFTGGIGWCRLK